RLGHAERNFRWRRALHAARMYRTSLDGRGSIASMARYSKLNKTPMFVGIIRQLKLLKGNTMKKMIVAGCFVALALGVPRTSFAQTAPTFVGVRTFLSARYDPDLDHLKADFAVLGVPFDEGTWGQPGERYGPRDMRENSQEYAHDLTEGFYYIDGDRTFLKGKQWVDVGDVLIYTTVAVETDAKIS